MAYPGEGYNMSNYGFKDTTPQEVVTYWKEYCRNEQRIHRSHLAVKGDGSKSFPGIAPLNEEQRLMRPSYYTSASVQHAPDNGYDRMFHINGDFNSRLHSDDRQHSQGLDIPTEEGRRGVPVRSSTEYGRRVNQPLEESSRRFAKVDRLMKGFYRSRGTNIPSSMQ